MNLKQVIKLKCRDCEQSTRIDCKDKTCPLHGLHKSKGKANRPSAIVKYCLWGLNGHPISTCFDKTCAIWGYRNKGEALPESILSTTD